jgi:hypothetical protein
LVEARRLVRAHRLWELFLIHGASIAPDHVDRDADSIEHVLSPEIIAELEARFAAEPGLRGTEETVPSSPHRIDQGKGSEIGPICPIRPIRPISPPEPRTPNPEPRTLNPEP